MNDPQLEDVRPNPADRIRFDVPHSARVWNYWLGGKDNYPADQAAGDEFIERSPEIVTIARASRQFLIRAVGHLAGEAGVRQFLDIGTGLPTAQNTHEVAQAVAPDSKIVYVDNDPLVLVHARALLVNTTPEGVTTYIDADVHDPDLIISDARNVLNFSQPIAVMLLGILGHATETFEEMRSIIRRLMDAVPSGSYLVLADGVDVGNEAFIQACQQRGYHLRTLDQIEECFEGLQLVEPGLVPVADWRPDPDVEPTERFDSSYAVIARKP